MNETDTNQSDRQTERSWVSLSRIQRRVAGVLVEKSKTTPAAYPMTLNAIKVACNQRSNRSPQMNLEEEEVEDTLGELRLLGAVTEMHSGGRALKYKHELYDWFGVDKAELAIMAELLLRGEQSLGDLRSRVARMEKIAGLDELKPIIARLLEKELMVEITPPGRGQIVTHNVYKREELDGIRANYVDGVPQGAGDGHRHRETSAPSDPGLAGKIEQLESQVEKLWQTVNELQNELQELKS